MRLASLIGLTLTLVLSACKGGGGGSDDPAANPVSSPPEYPALERNFPYADRLSFNRQKQGDVISLSDRSLWYVSGDYSAGQDATNTHDITLYEDGGQYGSPTTGARGTHYMFLDGSTRSFYVEYVPGLGIATTDTLPFHREKLNALIAFSDGSLWLIVGDHSSGQDILDTQAVTLYTNLDSMPDIATTGRKAAHYLHAPASSRGFYIEQVSGVTVERKGTATFSRETVGDNIQLDDGSLWHIKGEHKFGQDALGGKSVTVYANVASVPDPTSGARADHYLYIYGASAGFFVEQL